MEAATLEIVRNYFSAIGSAMAHVIERTSYSSYVTESADFAAALATPEGEFFAYPASAGVSNFLGLTLTRTIEEAGGNESMREGDILMTNDPYSTDGLSTHLPDVHIIKPIFSDGEIIAYAWCFVHTGDIGGSVPSSLTPAATDIQMEGLRIPPVRLYNAGELSKDIRNIYLSASRMPNLMMGDLNGMISAVNTAESRLHEAVSKFGIETVREAMYKLLELSDKRARKVISEIPDGKYSFEDYLDDDVESNVPLRVAIDITVEGSDIYLDYTRSDPQTHTAFNLITNGSRHAYLYQGLLAHIISEDPFIPMNGGITYPFHINAPKGTIANAQYPAAGGIRHPVSLRLYNALLGALAKSIPNKLQAAGAGQAAIVTLSLPDETKGGAYAATVVEPMGGGGGGQFGHDGNDGIDSAAAYLKNTPIEGLEARTDILVHSYELVPDTAGAGKYRGGESIQLSFEPLRDGAIVGARGQDRLSFQPWGLVGGKAGNLGEVYLDKDTADEQKLSKLKMLPVEKNHVITFVSPSGGGWGNPLERDSVSVLGDVINGLLSVEKAKDDYGVVIVQSGEEYSVSQSETMLLREKMLKNGNTEGKLFDLGQARDDYESVWSNEASSHLAILLQKKPYSQRSKLKQQAHIELGAVNRALSVKDIDEWFNKLR